MIVRRIAVPTPFPVGDVNAYLLDAAPLTLVDCGPDTPEAWDALAAGVDAAGCDLARVERLLLTHPHHDHAGLAGRVRRASGCAVYAHPLDHPRLRDDPGAWEGVVRFVTEACRRGGMTAAEVAEVRRTFDDIPRYADPPDALEPLGEGDVLASSAGDVAVLHTPGHARGALSFLLPGGEDLLAGDTLIPRVSSNAILEPGEGTFRQRTLLRYRATLERVAALGLRRVLPGHGDAVEDPGDLVRDRFRLQELRAGAVRRRVASGATTPWEIARSLFPGAGTSFLALSEVVGHLDLLAERGEVRLHEGDAWRVEPTP